MKKYDYIIVGSGIAGCSVGYFLSKYNKNILLIDRNEDFSKTASSVAGGFLSPLLGKPNDFKDLVTKALKYSVEFYKQNFPQELINKGVLRIPKNNEEKEKFKTYIPYMDFDFSLKDNGAFFPIGSQVLTQQLCQNMTKDIKKVFNCYIEDLAFENNTFTLNSQFKTENLILTTGADINLIDEEYFNIRAVWGQRVVAKTSSSVDINYHKSCSISTTKKDLDGKNIVNIGATHHRFDKDSPLWKEFLKEQNIAFLQDNDSIKNDTKKLIEYAQDIINLENLEIIETKLGARASSVDYFPIVGSLVDSKKSLEMFPYIKNGTNVPNDRLKNHKNIFVLNGLGGRGFVLAPYLANILVEHLINKEPLEEKICSYRLFKRWAKKN